MRIRLAETGDLHGIMHIFALAREFMRAHGNPTQWADNRPDRETVLRDIEERNCYVFEEETGGIHAVFSLIFGEDPTYKVIEQGAWLNDAPYATLHRVASDGTVKHVVQSAVRFAQGKINVLRADTHRDNLAMQNALIKSGFVYCGVIHVQDGSERLAYQWIA